MELTINNITKQYGNVTVLDDVSYRFTPGIYGILGANGAGKTTLFRIICGLMRANCGNIQYDHKDIALQAEYYRSILGFLPQDFRYYPDFTGLNFMMYIASLKGLNGKIAKKRCLDLLIQVGLDDVKNKKIRKYSGGMKQILGIAQAMINNPEILILDEPTVGLDPKERVKFRKLISSFASEKIVIFLICCCWLSIMTALRYENMEKHILLLEWGIGKQHNIIPKAKTQVPYSQRQDMTVNMNI